MCVIIASPTGARLPDQAELREAWLRNPHGAGYMVARNNRVEIHKGFMVWPDFIRAIRDEHLTPDDAVVYHFRIATQGGVNPWMTHPFPLSSHLDHMQALDINANVGIAHNGIIPITSSSKVTDYSDTALFVANILSKLIRSGKDITNAYVKASIEALIGTSRLAIMERSGAITRIGKWYSSDGLWYSNPYCISGADGVQYGYGR